MTELFTHYEQQFGNISAEITAKICKIPNLHGCEFNCEFDNLLKLTRVVASFKLKTALFYFFLQHRRRVQSATSNDALMKLVNW